MAQGNARACTAQADQTHEAQVPQVVNAPPLGSGSRPSHIKSTKPSKLSPRGEFPRNHGKDVRGPHNAWIASSLATSRSAKAHAWNPAVGAKEIPSCSPPFAVSLVA